MSSQNERISKLVRESLNDHLPPTNASPAPFVSTMSFSAILMTGNSSTRPSDDHTHTQTNRYSPFYTFLSLLETL